MSKQVKPIPDGYHTLTPYLSVKGASKAIEFYKKALGAVEIDRCETTPGTIMHAEIQIGNSRIMLADEFPEMGFIGPTSIGGTPVSLMLYVENVDKLAAQAIEAGMKVDAPVADQFYGDRMGRFTDPFGHKWAISTHIEDLTLEEITKRSNELFGNKKSC
jgi:PhnB protein